MTTLTNIRTKVRRLTSSPSTNNLSNDTIDRYINDFYLYDLPNHIKLANLKTVYTFYTEPNIEKYTPTVNPSFTDQTISSYSSFETPVYIAGVKSFYTQSRDQFYGMYPRSNVSEDLASGNGGPGAYAFTITNAPVLSNNVTISVTDVNGNNLVAIDNGAGGFTGDVSAGAINYVTGAITALIFTDNIPTTSSINTQSVPYVASKPSSVLFYQNVFTLRPIPDKTYRIDINAYILPTVLLNDSDEPQLNEIWQLLAAGASKKILEDRKDNDEVNSLMPFYSEQMSLALRRTIEQNRQVRTATIYSQQAEYGCGNICSNYF